MKPMLMRSQRPNLVCTKDFPVVLQAHFSAFPNLLPLQSTGLKQQSRTTQMSNPDGSGLHPYVNPPAAPPPGSPATELDLAREAETDASDFVPSQLSSQAATTADDSVPR